MSDERYAPVGAIVLCSYWQEHYTVLSHNLDGTVTVRWHGDARCANPLPPRESTHRTPLDPRDRVLVVPDLTAEVTRLRRAIREHIWAEYESTPEEAIDVWRADAPVCVLARALVERS